jgi:N-acetylmuramoyl-L-alanine amidase
VTKVEANRNAIKRRAFLIFLLCFFIANRGTVKAAENISNLLQKSNLAVVIDPGHSPLSPGAIGCSGKKEYSYNSMLAKVIAGTLERKGVSVTLSKPYNSEQSLLNRSNAATTQSFFLSIHHDSVQQKFISSSTGCSKKASGYSIFISQQNAHYDQSLQYARRLGEALIKKDLRPSRHHSEAIPGENRKVIDSRLGIYLFDELAVLKNTKIPALLFEAAVIVNPDDEIFANSVEYRQSIADAVSDML